MALCSCLREDDSLYLLNAWVLADSTASRELNSFMVIVVHS